MKGSSRSSARVSPPNLLPLLGVQPVLGRSFSIEEAEQRQRLVLISHRFWRARFGGSSKALGATLVLNGMPSQIIGVLPADFQVARFDADVWEPHPTHPSTRGGQTWFVIGRLRPTATFEQAQAEMSALSRHLDDQRPATERSRGITVVPVSQYMVGRQSRLALWMLGGAVFLVFLIAAANVTSLSLARSSARAREMALRAAVGASAGRIVRQLLTGSLVLAAVSGLLGMLLALTSIRLIRAFGTTSSVVCLPTPSPGQTSIILYGIRFDARRVSTGGIRCGSRLFVSSYSWGSLQQRWPRHKAHRRRPTCTTSTSRSPRQGRRPHTPSRS
ncbi:ABC transporter permease [Luteitalea pratensis]|uniref:ABC transporter permease n=1 Tax=Luteitalea pratensis TaxID=1855912 RepID=UPI000D72F681|nr:ABC transporter permease [Luteitalea pratensis]